MKSKCKNISFSIIKKHFPNQLPVYEIYADDFIDQALADVDITELTNEKGNFEAGDSLFQTLELITVIASVAGAMFEYINLRNSIKLTKKERLLKIEMQWKEKLTKSGIPDSTAESIIREFAKDIIE